ncbi:MAG: carbohydrate ABC transporter permease [Caldisericia bacterium]|nr:carbohydrate ABC transporter permease [Caldisericia bacterium]
MKKSFKGKTLTTFGIIILSIVIFFPFYWLLISSFKTPRELLSAEPTFIPFTFTFNHYYRILFETDYPRYMLNSLFLATITTIIIMILSVLSAFSLSNFYYPLKKQISLLILFTRMFPGVLLMIPIYVLMANLGLLNSLWSLIIVYVTMYSPVAIFLLKSFLDELPKEFLEASYIDGASKMTALHRIILPLATPGLVTVAAWSFILSWSEYLFGMLLINDISKQTVVVGLAAWMGEYYIDWGAINAGAILITLPVVILFAFLGKGFIKGLTIGGIKG